MEQKLSSNSQTLPDNPWSDPVAPATFKVQSAVDYYHFHAGNRFKAESLNLQISAILAAMTAGVKPEDFSEKLELILEDEDRQDLYKVLVRKLKEIDALSDGTV